jgi:phage terminase small subunit
MTATVFRTGSGLTLQQRLFVAEYLVDRDPVAAAERAGFERAHGTRLMQNLRVRAAVELRTEAMATRIEHVQAEDVMREAARLAFSDIRGIFTDGGELREPKDWPDDVAKTIASIDMTTSKPRGGVLEHVTKVRSWDKTKALELMAKIFGMVQERHHHTHEITLLNLAEPQILLEMSDEEIKVLDRVVKRVYGGDKKKGRARTLAPAPAPVLDAEPV